MSKGDRRVIRITYKQAKPWILQKHYAKRMPSVSFAFGLEVDNHIIGVVTFGRPASPAPCKGVAGAENKDLVWELNRLCIQEGHQKNDASVLVSGALSMMPKPSIILSYADTSVGHIGYIYQATNFLYTGLSAHRTDVFSKNGKHQRHLKADKSVREVRARKHRYIYICANKRDKKRLMSVLKYKQEPYPKGDNRRYDSGAPIVQPIQTAPAQFSMFS